MNNPNILWSFRMPKEFFNKLLEAILGLRLCRSSRICAALSYRRSRFFSRALLMISSSLGGSLGFSSRLGTGVWCRMASWSITAVSPLKAEGIAIVVKNRWRREWDSIAPFLATTATTITCVRIACIHAGFKRFISSAGVSTVASVPSCKPQKR